MKRLVLALWLGTAAASAATMSIQPETVYDCTNGLGRVSVSWSGAGGPVEVRVGSAQGTSMTGPVGPSGTASTGDWVTDGLTFYLVSQQGAVEGQTSARVRCGQAPAPADSSSYFPLSIGNHWVYRYNSRAVTFGYVTRTVTGSEVLGGFSYFTIADGGGEIVSRLRTNASGGKILKFTGTAAAPAESVLLDPATALRQPYTGPLGVYADAAHITRFGSLTIDDDIYVPGIGLVKSESLMITGSSGGFLSGLELVEARLAGGIRLAVPVPQLSLSIESAVLDVTGRKVTNCAVPSYCVACGLIGADPPNTYKPCAQARIEGPAGAVLELRNAAGAAVFRAPDSPASLRYVQVPLYAQPNQPLPPGVYTLVGSAPGQGEASLTVRIE